MDTLLTFELNDNNNKNNIVSFQQSLKAYLIIKNRVSLIE